MRRSKGFGDLLGRLLFALSPVLSNELQAVSLRQMRPLFRIEGHTAVAGIRGYALVARSVVRTLQAKLPTSNSLVSHAQFRLRIIQISDLLERMKYCLEVDGIRKHVFQVFTSAEKVGQFGEPFE